MQHKKSIRLQIKSRLQQLSQAQKLSASHAMTNLIFTELNQLLSTATHIACYWPMQHEINTIELINKLLINHKKCYLPVIKQNNNLNHLVFIEYNKQTTLHKHKYKILEPRFDPNHQISITQLDLIFIPLIAFDLTGNRIGSGAGLYDHSLSLLKIKNTSCKLIGLGYSMQQHDNIIPDDWDLKLDLIITEQKCYFLNIG